MNVIRGNESISRYLQLVCEQVKAKEIHPEIRQELQTHLEEVIAEKSASGVQEEQAIQEALGELGDPIRLGSGLHKAHKPKIEWGLLLLMVFFIALALVAMLSVDAGLSGVLHSTLLKHEFYIGLGIVGMIGLFFFDYRKLVPFSSFLFILCLLAIMITKQWGIYVNGVPSGIGIGPFYVGVDEISPYLLIIAMAGILTKEKWQNAAIWLKFGVFAFLPCLIMMQSHFSSTLLVYFAGYIAVLIASKAKWREFLLNLAGLLVVGMIYVGSAPYRIERIKTFFHPYGASRDARYMIVNSQDAIQSAGWWGHGFGAVNRSLPSIHSEMIFSYLVYTLGWVMGIVIIIGCMLLVARLLQTAGRVKDRFARMFILGLTGILSIKFVWGIAMTVGLLPIVGIQLPFMSYGGEQLLLHCCLIGLAASAYRRKDTIALPHQIATK